MSDGVVGAMSGQPINDLKDFQPFLDAAIKSGERTRRVIYILILICVFISCSIRAYIYPAWTRHVLFFSIEVRDLSAG
jgi:hypothetical protein